MKRLILSLFISLILLSATAQKSTSYTLSFQNAVHHQSEIKAVFTNLKSETEEFRMSRTSPGRYALHEFSKNIYNLKATDGAGKELTILRQDPYSWTINGHNGTVIITYTLFANHGDGTYAQIDESHAHLNAPATFLYAPSLSEDQFEVKIIRREDLNWKIATQLKHEQNNTYFAKDLDYLMDSPIEISDFQMRSFEVNGQTIRFVLHHQGTSAEFDTFFENTKKIVLQQMEIYGELPNFDYNEYTFLGCYMPQVSGDGMEHRNSTIVTSTQSLANGAARNIGTVSHEFFHCWNVERIRPKSLEPFDYEAVNMSGELWFAEGFTSYYGGLILTRAGITKETDYIKNLQGSFNYVWTSPGRSFYNPVEMSYQAPFNDAARSVDDINKDNLFISYYSYGHMIGLALDLSLRKMNLTLDDYMKLVWKNYGKTEIPYTNKNLQATLNEYAGNDFGDSFFNRYIFGREMPEFNELFAQMGVAIRSKNKINFGAYVRAQEILNYPTFESMAYNAGLTKGDKILQIGSIVLNPESNINELLSSFNLGDSIPILYERIGKQKQTSIIIKSTLSYEIQLFEELGKEVTSEIKSNRNSWLKAK